jgi:hypothetical protein
LVAHGLAERWNYCVIGKALEALLCIGSAGVKQLIGALRGGNVLAELRLVFEGAGDPDEKARLAFLQEILTGAPITARAHRELNTLRRSGATGDALVEQLLRIVRDYDLETAYRAISDDGEGEALIPRIVCSEALL